MIEKKKGLTKGRDQKREGKRRVNLRKQQFLSFCFGFREKVLNFVVPNAWVRLRNRGQRLVVG